VAPSLQDFPADFVWGTATAAYQIEGATSAGGRGPSIWDTFARTPGAIRDGETGDRADEHYDRFLADVEMMASLGVNAYRFSIAWSRIQPDGTGPASAEGVAFYRRLAQALGARGITPYATLYHWDLPAALEERGGWLNRETADRFADYASLVADELGDVIDHWITLNEPWCSAFLGYASGEHAPGKRVGTEAAHAAHHLLLGHGRAVHRIRAARPSATVGLTVNLYAITPATGSDADRDAARRIDGLQNRMFLEPTLRGGYPADVLRDLGQEEWFASNPASDAREIAAPIDFLGINYYSRHTVRAGQHHGVGTPHFPGADTVEFVETAAALTQMGWPVDPDGMVEVLESVHAMSPELPLYITENGSAFEDVLVDGVVDDEERRAYLEQHVEACAEAVRRGLPLKGYFVWSLMDNFEWAWGYSRRFGLFHVDYASQQRTLKESGRWFADFLGATCAEAV
jgi:beta-glucosidase